jgi:hypothetical protein
LELGFGGVLTERPHDGAEFFGGDGAVAVFVEEGEGLFEFCDARLDEALVMIAIPLRLGRTRDLL